MILVEQNKRECKICLNLKDRILAGKFDKVNKKWCNKDGIAWNGNTCPECHQIKCREEIRKRRAFENATR